MPFDSMTFYIVMAGLAIFGIVSTIAYYFFRFVAFKDSPEEAKPDELAEPPPRPDFQKTPSFRTEPEPLGHEGAPTPDSQKKRTAPTSDEVGQKKEPLKTPETSGEASDKLSEEDLLRTGDQTGPVEEVEKAGALASPEEQASEKSVAEALVQTKASFWGRIRGVFASSPEQEDPWEEIEEVLYTSDLGPGTVQALMESSESHLSRSDRRDSEKVRLFFKDQMLQMLEPSLQNENVISDQFAKRFGGLELKADGPVVWLIVGVNGAGKTTSIGKLAHILAQNDRKVLVAAGDTFRAAAGGQLKAWTERAQVEIFHPEGVSDPSAVAFDACAKAKARGYDFVIIDTAGRLPNQEHLMEELRKINRVVQKVIPEGPHEVVLVLDANSGQNALQQAKLFQEAVNVSSVVLTKMDGTAKGGVALGINHEYQLPIRLIGVGESIGDLRPFDVQEFVDSIL